MGEVLFPAVSHLEGRGELAGARRLTMLVAWTLTSGFGTAAVVLAVVGGDFLHLWISPEAAREATSTLRLLCVAGPIGMAAIAPFYYLLGIGRTKWDAASALIVGAIVVGAGLVLVPRYGMRGVGYGLIVAVLVRWVLLGLIWRSCFREDVSFGTYAAHVYAPALTSIVLLAALVQVHAMIGRSPSWPWLAVETAVALMVVAGAQLLANELLPGGRQRRQDVVASFKPVLAKAMGMFADR
jgi:O-antigen/teichoic acid export membrane protein